MTSLGTFWIPRFIVILGRKISVKLGYLAADECNDWEEEEKKEGQVEDQRSVADRDITGKHLYLINKTQNHFRIILEDSKCIEFYIFSR